MDRHAGLHPDVRQPGAGPRGGNIRLDVVRRPLAGLAADDRRIDVAIAELGADHAGRFMRLDRGDVEQMLAGGLAVRGVILDPGAISVAPDLATGVAAA